jgi:TPR repeat protein
MTQDLAWEMMLDSTLATKEYKEASGAEYVYRIEHFKSVPTTHKRQWSLKAANLGNIDGIHQLARMAVDGGDYREAVKLYAAISMEDMTNAMVHNMFLCYYDKRSAVRDVAKAKVYAMESVNRNDTSSFSNLGQLLIEEEDKVEEGVALLKQAQNDPWAPGYLGSHYYKTKEYDLALPYLKDATSLHSKFGLAIMYFYGLGVDQSFETALSFFRLSQRTEKYKVRCTIHIGYMYLMGLGVQKSTNMAWNSFHSIKKNGDAQYWLGCMHENGIGMGVKKNTTKAMEFYAKGVENKCERACVALADLLVSSNENLDKAKELYQLVAESDKDVRVFALVGLNRIKEALDMEVDDHAQYAPMFAFKMAQVWKKHGKRRKGYLKQVKKYLTMSAKLGHDQAKGCLEMLFPKDVPPAFKRMCT